MKDVEVNPTNPESTKNEELPSNPSRRHFLKILVGTIGAAITAPLFGIKLSPQTSEASADTQEQRIDPGEYWRNFDWNQLREDIMNLPDKYASLKESALPIVDRLEYGALNVFPIIDDIYRLYSQRLGSDNKTPELVELIKIEYGALINQHTDYPKQLAERRISFLSDRNEYINQFAWFVTSINFAKQGYESSPADPNQKNDDWFSQINTQLDKLDEKYLNVAAFKEEREFEFSPFYDQPLSEDGEKLYQQDTTTVEAILKEFPWLKKIMIKIALYSPTRYGYPETKAAIHRFAGTFEKDYRQGVITLNLERYDKDIDAETIKGVFIHEMGHLLDPLTNTNLLYFFTPEQMIELIALRQKAILDPSWGRNYPHIDKMFDSTETLPDPDTPASFQKMSGVYPMSILVNNYYGWKDTEVFAPSLAELSDPPLEEVLLYPQRNDHYLYFSDFVNANPTLLNSWLNNTVRNVRIIAEGILENPKRFDGIGLLRNFNRQFDITDKSAEGYWKLTAYAISNAIYTEAFFKGNRKVLDYYSPDEQSRFNNYLIDMIHSADREYFAEGIMNGYYLAGVSPEISGPNPFETYLQTTSVYLA